MENQGLETEKVAKRTRKLNAGTGCLIIAFLLFASFGFVWTQSLNFYREQFSRVEVTGVVQNSLKRIDSGLLLVKRADGTSITIKVPVDGFELYTAGQAVHFSCYQPGGWDSDHPLTCN